VAWTIVGIFGGFGLGCLSLLTRVIGHLGSNLGQRIAELGAAFDRFERLVDTRFDQVDGRLNRVENRLDRVEGRPAGLEDGFLALRSHLTAHVTGHTA